MYESEWIIINFGDSQGPLTNTKDAAAERRRNRSKADHCCFVNLFIFSPYRGTDVASMERSGKWLFFVREVGNAFAGELNSVCRRDLLSTLISI